jgi:hypothetical protein
MDNGGRTGEWTLGGGRRQWKEDEKKWRAAAASGDGILFYSLNPAYYYPQPVYLCHRTHMAVHLLHKTFVLTVNGCTGRACSVFW